METIKKHLTGILLCLFELIVGILVLVDAIGFTTVIIIAAGIGLIVLGLVCAVKYGRTESKKAAEGQYLLKGLLALTAGFFCAFQSQWFLDHSAFAILLGLAVFTAGLVKIQSAWDMLRAKNLRWYYVLIGAAISIICAIVILKYDFAGDDTRAIFTGVTLIVECIVDAAMLIVSNTKKEEPKKVEPKKVEPKKEEPAKEEPAEEESAEEEPEKEEPQKEEPKKVKPKKVTAKKEESDT